ncbi:MAG TPA: putative peptidoglycan glycosyltransferase FtsW [Planctomycetota bacterium]|jgi:cell division protein FtsW|nr:putative peptidoglycan glycosyltransferase FtsW [Planctomycetota bacterium]
MTARWLRIQLWFLVVVLCCFGLVMITSSTAMGTNVVAAGSDGITYAFLIKQAIAMAAGAIVAMVIGGMGAERLRQGWVVALVVVGALGSLALVHVIGREINGAKRWIDLGPINLQPAELAKFALVIAAAWHLSRVAERVRSSWYGVVVPLFGFALVAGLVYLTKDLGSVVVMAVVLGAMIIFAGAPWWYMVTIGGLCAPALIYYTVIQVSYRRDRMLAFLDPWNSEGPAAYHLRQSFIAIGSGGLFGVGLGQSTAKLAFLPEKHTDFIFAVICEELGLIGALSVAAAYLLLVYTGLLIAAQARDRHLRLLAIGSTVVLGTQAFWNMLVVTGAVPTKGLTLPFISYGGSSVVVCLALIGVLDAVAQANVRATNRTSNSRIGAAVRTDSDKAWRWQTEGAT